MRKKFTNERMPKVIIIVNAHVNEGKISPTAPVAEKMATAMKEGIINSDNSITVEIMGAADLWAKSVNLPSVSDNLIYCPLTIKLPNWFHFSAQRIYQACREIDNRRKWVKEHFSNQIGNDNLWLGDLWLPVIKTKEIVSYGDIIGEGEMPNSYQQPFPFADNRRDLLYSLAHDLLDSIKATPAVYLLQFKILEQKIFFDRLWPFPATPAIASLNHQQPNLFTYHWLCLSHQSLEFWQN